MFKRIHRAYNKMPIVVHPVFIVLGIYFLFTSKFYLFICYTISALFHELGHFVFARYYGYKQLQIKLMPYGAQLSGALDKIRYVDEIYICIGGPLFSLVLSVTLIALWWISPNVYNLTYDLMFASLVCGIFNFLPIYPLDGGRLIVAKLSTKMKREKAVAMSFKATRVFAVILFVLFLITIFFEFNITLGIVAIMLYVSSLTKNKATYIRLCSLEARQENLRYGVEIVELIIPEDMQVYKLFKKLRQQKFYNFVVVDNNYNIIYKFGEQKLDKVEIEEYKKSFKELKNKLQ